MWAWTLNKKQCFQLIDQFYHQGFRQVDAATNYPINKQAMDFRAAENILLEWIAAHGITDLEVIMKVGSINNLGVPDHNLNQSFLLLNLDDYQHRFTSNLHTLMIHWDNRNSPSEISDSLKALQVAQQRGLEVGLSGIKHPEIYAELNASFQLDFRIQVKHNLFQSTIDHYSPLQDRARFLAYGINAGGIKLQPDQYQADSNLIVRGGQPTTTPLHERIRGLIPKWNQLDLPEAISQFNHIALIYAYHHPKISGILIGPSRPKQLMSSIQFFEHLQKDHYRPVYQALQNI